MLLEELKQVLADALALGRRVEGMDGESALLGAIPELDSMAVISVITAIEERFSVRFEDDELGAEHFETLGSLARLVRQKLAPRAA